MAERITKNQPLEAAVVRYPGSNCDFDTLEFFNRNGHHAQFLFFSFSICWIIFLNFFNFEAQKNCLQTFGLLL